MKAAKAAKKHKAVEVEVELYRLHVIVVIGWTLDDILAHAKKHKIMDGLTPKWQGCVKDAIDSAQGLCTHFGENNSDVLIWLKKFPEKASEYGTLWHELVHAVDRIANHADPHAHFYAHDWTSEPRAFLYEFLATKITQDLWNRK